ncbi:hypothetical protein QCD60_02590 [Pokkaliibacter sp. MBI-7]|uniref:DUF6602 domain-containing protein n=1 Tax=Pokkaliibacter sp. MBI-7 TaxID=3040600 RepID=UPI00244A6BE2|nr:DUF6602 domain-containing protein [Pokkaliibacter sp. MBI-7]MDH2431445.1 hypothetical protein [Pokkaliibacter sp. MBI-7]
MKKVTNKAKNESNQNGPEYLRNCFKAEAGSLNAKIQYARKSITHDGIMGAINEQHFIDFLKRHLPQRYSADSGIIIDSNGKTSDQIDIVIYDNYYTPTFFSQMIHRFIPAEAVYGVIEVKPCINAKTLKAAGEKAKSVRALERTNIPVVTVNGTFTKKDFHFIAGIIALDMDWNNNIKSPTLENNLKKLNKRNHLDFGLALNSGSFDYFDEPETENDKNNKNEEEHKTSILNREPKENALGYLLFRLLSKLQTFANPPAADWKKYADVMRQLPDPSSP